MFQNNHDLVKGKTYYIKRIEGEILGNLIFYDYSESALWFVIPGGTHFDFDSYSYYI